jgi:predicted GIY-YIG superfamily endonuclease|tara:strand:- start:39 stop:368 length:330 start_codon:yes stop_codon:yes gene_type:complete
MTNDFLRRWKQHNRILKGGAKYTSKHENWTPVCIIDGFETMSEAMQCEWKLKRPRGLRNRIINLVKILENDQKWTKNSPEIKNQKLNVYTTEQFKSLFQTIKTRELVWF